MSSLMTNAASMSALQTLRSINDQMEVTQNRISSGYRVATASDNAAYWSIATTMRSDNSAMSTVSDALGLGAAQVDVAYTAMESVKDTLNSIKQKLTAAGQPGVDKSKIQTEIEQLQNDLKTFASSASFNGSNWLDVTGVSTEKVVASFIRSETGGISLGTIDIDTSGTALFNSTDAGLLEADGNQSLNSLAVNAATSSPAVYDPAGTTTAGASIEIDSLASAITLDEGDSLSFDLSFGGETKTVSIVGQAGGTVVDSTSIVTLAQDALDTAFGAGNFTTAASTDGAGVKITAADPANDLGNGQSITVSNLAAIPGQIDVMGIDITGASNGQINAYLNGVDRAFNAVTTAASNLGAIKTRIGSQQDFVGKLMDAVDRGVGQLVDADMDEESTRLKALQTQQQLGIQALSIANSNSQNILSLFRS